jgi:formylglycine-generating enzyme required for sulfatase activity
MVSRSAAAPRSRTGTTKPWWLGPAWTVVGLLLALGGYAGYQINWFKSGEPPDTMISIAAAEFEMGSSRGEPDEAPPHRVRVNAFRIDPKEVTVADYQICVAARACAAAHTDLLYCNAGKPGRETHPINCVTLLMAENYCKWRHARLPTEAEWERAARGNDGRAYPWGSEDPLGRACYLRRRENQQTCPVGSFASDKSPFGVIDMAGNVSEWTISPYCSYVDPKQCKPGVHVVRGGSWDMDNAQYPRTSYRDWVDDGRHGYNLGFRCASE